MLDLGLYGYEGKDILILEAAKEFSKSGLAGREITDDESADIWGYMQRLYDAQSFAEYAAYIGAGVTDQWLNDLAHGIAKNLLTQVKNMCNEPFAFHAVIGFIALDLIDKCAVINSDFDTFIDAYMSEFPPDSRPWPWSDESISKTVCRGEK